MKGPKTRASIRRVTLDPTTLAELAGLRVSQQELGSAAGAAVDVDSFVFAAEPPWTSPPHPDAMSHAFSRVRKTAGVPDDLHLHSLRHFHATVLDPVVSERQKQARLGWSTAHMARHYTDAIHKEDRRAAKHVGNLLDRAPSTSRRSARPPTSAPRRGGAPASDH